MKPNRKAAREFVNNIRTREELRQYIDMLNLREEDKEIAMLVFGNGWSRAKIAIETGYSEHQIKRKLAKIYDKLL